MFRSVHVFDSTQSFDSCFGYVETTALTQQNVKHPFKWQLPGATSTLSFCKAQSKFNGSHFEFKFFLDLVEAPIFFLTGVVSVKVLLQVDSHGYLIFSFCTLYIFFRVRISSVFSCVHVITQTQDIITGILVGNDAKETKIQKVAKKRNPYKKVP